MRTDKTTITAIGFLVRGVFKELMYSTLGGGDKILLDLEYHEKWEKDLEPIFHFLIYFLNVQLMWR